MDVQEEIVIEVKQGFLLGSDGADLATQFCNTYVRAVMLGIADLSARDAASFAGSVAGQSLSFMFQNIDLNQLDSVLDQIKTYVVASVNEIEAQEQVG